MRDNTWNKITQADSVKIILFLHHLYLLNWLKNVNHHSMYAKCCGTGVCGRPPGFNTVSH